MAGVPEDALAATLVLRTAAARSRSPSPSSWVTVGSASAMSYACMGHARHRTATISFSSGKARDVEQTV